MSDKLVRRAYVAEMERADGNDDALVVTISTGGIDRFNTVLDPQGWDLSNYKKNPVVMWAHQREQLPIAKCTKIWLEGAKLKAQVDFSESAKISTFAAQVKAYYDAGLLNGWSVGFIPLETEYPEAVGGPGMPSTRQKPVTFRKMELVEFSGAPIPANPDALSGDRIFSRSVGDAVGMSDQTREQMELVAMTKSPLLGEWIKDVYERSINDRADAKPADPAEAPRGATIKDLMTSRMHDGYAKAADALLALGHVSQDERMGIGQACGDGLRAFGDSMDEHLGDAAKRIVPNWHGDHFIRSVDNGPCCGDVDDEDVERALEADDGFDVSVLDDWSDTNAGDKDGKRRPSRKESDDQAKVSSGQKGQWDDADASTVKKAADYGGVGSKQREEMPAHVFLDQKNKKYPVKTKQGGEWKLSCSQLKAAISRANSAGATGISKRAQALYAKNCGKKRSFDVVGARRRVFDWAGGLNARFQKACAVRDLLCHHDVVDDHLVTSADGVRRAMATLLTSPSDFRSSEDGRAAYAHLSRHYEEFGLELPAVELESRDWTIWNEERAQGHFSKSADKPGSPKGSMKVMHTVGGSGWSKSIQGFDSREHAGRFAKHMQGDGHHAKVVRSSSVPGGVHVVVAAAMKRK